MTNEIKSIGGVRRREGVTREELLQRWETAHAPFVARHAEPDRYRVTFFESRADGSPSPYDGLAELWFRDREHLDAWYGEESQRGADNFNELVDSDGGFRLITTEYVMVDGDASRESEKVVYLVKRRDDVSPADFFRHWREVHAPNVRAAVERTEGCLRYAISHAVAGERGAYDGIAEIWWRDGEARRRGLQGVEDDGFGRLTDPNSIVVLVGHEFAVVE